MKLSKLYCNKDFNTVLFNEEFNVVLGEITKPDDSTKDSHNLGKTTLIYLIDFLLLKTLIKDHFLYENLNKFKDHIFFLEILLNDGTYLTVRRSVLNSTKISFKKHPTKDQDYTNLLEWDILNLPLKKAKETLNSILNFDVLKNYSYRESVSYFLRTQDDYLDVFQLSKFNRSEHSAWKPLLFEILGFDSRNVNKKYEIDKEIDNVKNAIAIIQKNSSSSPEEIDKIKGLIQIKEVEKSEYEAQIDKFDFYKAEFNINNELVYKIERDISKFNSLRYKLEYELKKIETSLDRSPKFNLSNIQKLFEEVKVAFPDQLTKDYKDLENFNNELYKERSDHLLKRKEDVISELKEINLKLKEYNSSRETALQFLNENDTFDKYKTYQNDKIKVEAELLRLKDKLKNVNEITSLNEVIVDLNRKREDLVKTIKSQVNDEQNDTYSFIRQTFYSIVKEILSSPAIISITFNKEGNIEYSANIQNEDETERTAKGKGTSYRKFLCMAFDLSILIAYSKFSYYKFVYHDGAFEGLDDRKKINLIKLIREICQNNGIQYILTTLANDLPRNGDDEIINFKEDEIVLKLSDIGDEGRLFKFGF